MLRTVRAAVEKLRVNDDGAVGKLLEKGDQHKARRDRDTFEELACKLLNTLVHETHRIYLLVDALRRSERKTVWPSYPCRSIRRPGSPPLSDLPG